MKLVLRSFLSFLLMLFLSPGSQAQEFPFRFFSDKVGNHHDIFAFHQNENKEILFVNSGGVFSFNSRETVELINFPKLGIGGIQQAHFTSGGLVVLSSGRVISIALRNKKAVNLRENGADGVFYNPEADQLYVYTNGTLDLITESGASKNILKNINNISQILFSSAKQYLVGNESISVYSADWDLLERINVGKPITDCSYSNDKLWILTATDIFSKEGETPGLRPFQPVEGLNPSCIAEDKTGKVWVGLQKGGVLLIDGNSRQILNLENNFALNHVQGIYESRDFSLWLYGKGGFVFKPFSAPFRKFRLGQHLAGEGVQDIKSLGNSKVAVLTNDGYQHLLEDEVLKSSTSLDLPFEPHFSRIIDATTSLHVGKSGNILFHTSRGNYRCSIRKEMHNVFTFDDRSLIVDEAGNTYIYDYSRHNLLKNDLVVSVEKPLFQSGNVLIYTDNAGNVKTWNSERGSELAIGAYTPEMLHAALLNEKYFVFLSKEKQLKYAVEGRVVNLDFKLELNEKVKSFFVSDLNLWISTENHLYQLGFYLKDDVLKLLEPKVFNAAEYSLQLPVSKSVFNEEGSYYLASESAVILYNSFALAPDISKPGLVPEKIYIKRADSLVSVNFQRADSVKINLAKDEQLLVKAFPVNYDTKSKVALKYRLGTGDERWNNALEEDLVLLSGLKPGRHVLEVISESEQGVKSAGKLRLYLNVKQEEWFNWWTIFGASLSLMLLGYFAYNGLRSVRDTNSKEVREKFEKELLKLQKKSHEQMMKAEGLKQINQLITAQKAELEDKNKQIVAQKYELSLTNSQIKQQKDVIEKTTEKLQSSINYAQRIQTALMGDEILIKQDLPESFVLFKPRDQVSGDFFWFNKVENEAGEEVVVIAAVDCTGHGVPGAIVSVLGIQLLDAIVKAKKITEPGKILTQLNIDLLDCLKFEQTQINDGMDMGICTINFNKGKLYFAGAKNPLYKIENGALEVFKGDKFPIGGQRLNDEKEYTTVTLDLRKDGSQMFYLSTDGYQDQFGGPNQSKYMVGNFKNLLQQISSKPMMEQKYVLGKTIKEWQGEEEQTDDILVMGFRI